jgi:glutamate 5-kinase
MVEGENPFARGLAGYSTTEIEKIKGAKTGDIESRLGYKYFDEVVHRDDLVLISHLERA